MNLLQAGYLFYALTWLSAGASPLRAAGTEYRFTKVQLDSCYDGDTCRFTFLGEHPLLGKNVPVRLLGIDTPEMNAHCIAEGRDAAKAQAALEGKLRRAHRIEVRVKAKDAYGRLLGTVIADKVNLNEWMLKQGYARPYKGGSRKSWCD